MAYDFVCKYCGHDERAHDESRDEDENDDPKKKKNYTYKLRTCIDSFGFTYKNKDYVAAITAHKDEDDLMTIPEYMRDHPLFKELSKPYEEELQLKISKMY